jgi:hypothetical protein
MSVCVVNGLAGLCAGVENDAVPAAVDARRLGDLVCLIRHLGQQRRVGRGQCGEVAVVSLRDNKDMRGRLRVDIAESKRPGTFAHENGGDIARDDLAE